MSDSPTPNADRLMTARHLADYLNLNERTVIKLVTDGQIPGVKVGNQWRFRKAMIDTWLDDQMLGLTPRSTELPTPPGRNRVYLDFPACFAVDHVIPDLAATTRNAAVAELAAHAEKLGLVRDRVWFVGALIERENLMPSATGCGLAFLHTARRHPEQVTRPFVILGRSRAGIDFDALDGNPTHLLFVLGLKYEELHLPWLAKLTTMLALPDRRQELLAAPDARAIADTLFAQERQLRPESDLPPADPRPPPIVDGPKASMLE